MLPTKSCNMVLNCLYWVWSRIVIQQQNARSEKRRPLFPNLFLQLWQDVTVPCNIDGSNLQKVQQNNSLCVPENSEEHFTCRGSCFDPLLGRWRWIFSLHGYSLSFGHELVNSHFTPHHSLKQKVITIIMSCSRLTVMRCSMRIGVSCQGHSLCWHFPVSKNVVDDFVSSLMSDSKFCY